MNPTEDDQRILGRSLRRAIESGDVRETSFHGSRIAAELERRPLQFGLWQLTTAAAAVVLVVGAGVYLVNRGPDPPAASLTPTPTGPTPTESPRVRLPGKLDHQVVYFARDRLPPTAEHDDDAGFGLSAQERIRTRLEALETARPSRAGSVNVVASSKARTASVRVSGDQVTVDYSVPADDWGTSGSAAVQGLVQQIVYTASEEPGIRRVLITQNGGQEAVIGGEGLIVDEPLTREAVYGFGRIGAIETIESFGEERRVTVTTDHSVDSVIGGLARFVIRFPSGERWLPQATASLSPNDEAAEGDLGKYVLTIEVPGATDATTGERLVEQTPLRAIYTTSSGGTVRYRLALDDLRPWRVGYLIDPVRLVVDIGGFPGTIGRNVVVYQPRPGQKVGWTFTVNGFARSFEANVPWQVRDADGRVVAQGFTTATIAATVWGGYEFGVTLPTSVRGAITLEVMEDDASGLAAPADITVSLPLAVR